MQLVGRFLILVAIMYTCESKKAVCKLYHYESSSFIGDVNFTQTSEDAQVKLLGRIQKLSPGFHGIHVHEYGDIGDNCNNAGGHFNPEKKNHGGPDDKIRHVGDLGNLEVAGDPFVLSIKDRLINLFPGKTDITGRVLAIHGGQDDLGRGNNTASKINGNSGPRIACCVIGIAPD